MSDQLNNYLKKWKLTNASQLTKTATGHIYKVDSINGPAILKIFTDTGIVNESAGTIFLKNLAGKGAAKLYEYDDRAQLIEYLPGHNLYHFSKKNNEDEATKNFIEIIKKIHSCENFLDKNKLTPIKDLFKLFDRINPPDDLISVFNKARKLSRHLLATQVTEVLLHGDLHHENILKNNNGEFVCFDPKGMIGDPAYELGTTLKNPWDCPEISQNIETFKSRALNFSKELNLPLERIIGFAFIHLCLSIGWAIEDGYEYSHQKILLEQVAKLI